MFSTLPKHKLRKAQEKFFRLNENIVPHLISALKNLQYNKGFYPVPDLVNNWTLIVLSIKHQLRKNSSNFYGGNVEDSK